MATRPDTPVRFVTHSTSFVGRCPSGYSASFREVQRRDDIIHIESKDHEKKLRINPANIVALSDDFSLFVFIRSRRLAGR